MYPSSSVLQGTTKQRKDEFPATREARVAYVARAREESKRTGQYVSEIPPALLTAREARERAGLEQPDRERSTAWLVEPIVFPLIQRLSRGKLGYSFATEWAMRVMVWVDTGHVYGERSISRRLRLEHKRGGLDRHVVPPGRRWRGVLTVSGTTTNRFPSEKERREKLWREKVDRQRQRREAKQRKRATRLVAREAPPAPAPLPPRDRPMPRTAIANLMQPFELHAVPNVSLFETTNEAARRAEIERQTELAKAHPDLWAEDEPPE